MTRIGRRLAVVGAALMATAYASAQITLSLTGPVQMTYAGTGENYVSAPVGVIVGSSVKNWRVFAAVDQINTSLGAITSKQIIATPTSSTPPAGAAFFDTTGSLSEFKYISNGTTPIPPSSVGSFRVSLSNLNPLTPLGTLSTTIRFFGRIGADPTLFPIAAVPLTINVRSYLSVAFEDPIVSMVARNPGIWNMLGRTKFTVRSNMPSASVQIAMSQLRSALNPNDAISKTLTSINYGADATDLKAKLTVMPLGINTINLNVGYGVTSQVVGTKVQVTLKQKPGTYQGQLTMTASGA